MIYRVIFFLLILTSPGWLFSQSRIYGVAGGHLVYFDYRSGEYDTIPLSYYIPSPNLSFGCTIDPFNGRYFFDSYGTSSTGPVRYIDLNTLEDLLTCSFPNKNNIEYNCLANAIDFENYDGKYYVYYLDSGTLQNLSTLPASSAMILGHPVTYNPVTNQYLFRRYAGGDHFDLIDASSGQLIHTQFITPANDAFNLVVDYKTGQYYGSTPDSIVICDPLKGTRTPVIKIPYTFGGLEEQMVVYDQDSSKYIIPVIFNSNIDSTYYLVIDVKKPRIDTLIKQPESNMNWQQIYCKPKTVLTRLGDTLFCSRGISYTWFLNGDSIPGHNISTLIPSLSGMYSVKVQFPTYSSLSNEVEFAMTGIENPGEPAILSLFPNPAKEELCFEVHGIFSNSGEYRISIFNLLGEMVFSMTRDGNIQQGKVNINSLPSGIYVISITSSDITIRNCFCHL